MCACGGVWGRKIRLRIHRSNGDRVWERGVGRIIDQQGWVWGVCAWTEYVWFACHPHLPVYRKLILFLMAEMRLRKLSAQHPYWWSGERLDTLHWQLVADPIYSICADCLRVWERGRERIVNLKWCVVKNSFVCSWQLKVKAWWLGHDKMFSNQASLGTTWNKSPSLLLFSHCASSGPLSFSFLSHYFSPHSFPIIFSFLCFLSLFQHAVSPPAPSLLVFTSPSLIHS